MALKWLPPVWLALLAVWSSQTGGLAQPATLSLAGAFANQPAETPPGPNLRFDRLSSADGLSFSLATSILQDRQGFLWFGTFYGLNKYDGFRFTPFILQSSGDVWSGNHVTHLYEDRTGDLWIATSADIMRRDRATGEFIHYRHDPANPRSLAEGSITAIGEDSSGVLWIGTNTALSRFDRSTQTFTPYLRYQPVLEFYVTRQGGVWLGTTSGLRHYAPGPLFEQQPAHYRHSSDPTSLSSDVVTAIQEDHEGILWVGTSAAGLDRLDASTGTFTHFQNNPYDPYSLSNDSVSCMLEDGSGRLWVGTDEGLNLFDQATGRFSRYRFDPDDPRSLIGDQVLDLYQDRSGVVWVATLSGIAKVNDLASSFNYLGQGSSRPVEEADARPTGPPGLSDGKVTSVYQDRQGIVWIGTLTGGLNRLDRDTGGVTVFRHGPADSASIGYGEVNAIYEDRAGTLWVGTDGGLDRFDPRTSSFESERALWGQQVASIVEDYEGSLWVGSSIGIMVRETGASVFTSVPLVSDGVSIHSVGAIHPDRSGAVWVATGDRGLFQLDPAEGSGADYALVHYPQESGNAKSPGSGSVMSFYEDAEGSLWMGGLENGLVRYDRESQTFAQYLPDTGPGNYVSCIQGDAQGYLWMGTKLGLARFDPATETFWYYDTRDGLAVGEGLGCFQNEEGEMFFGSWLGLNTFYPDQIRDNLAAPPVVITALSERSQALHTDLRPDEQVRLSYRENYLSFDFAALDFTAPAKNEYAYRMEGLDAGWIVAGTRRHADYPDLRPGSYTFRVKASNNSGVWNEQGAAVRITITPPFWQTWWFPGLLGIVLLGAISVAVRLRVRSVEARSRDLEKQVSERTSALEQKTRELQQLYERSHELAVMEERSRLARELHDAVTQTLFSASLVAEALPATWERDPQEGRSLLRGLRGMCRGALAEMRTLLLELRPAALVETRLEDLLRQLGEAASGREGIPVTVHVEDPVQLPPDVHMAFYRIAQEALNNAIKHARATQMVVRLHSFGEEQPADRGGAETVPTGRIVLLSIGDDGRGFDPAQIPHSRLGLGIMHERAQAIGGVLAVESQLGRGTQVTVLWEQEGRQEAI